MSQFQPDRIVVPVDFSNDSAAAVETALEIADGDAKRLNLIHVLVKLPTMTPDVIWNQDSDKQRERAIEEQFATFFKQHDYPEMPTTIRLGDPGLHVADFASEIEADLIVIPSHGYHGVKRLLLGSVTERVLRYAHCSVLVLRRSDAE